MKKLAIVLLLVVACQRKVEVGSPSATTPGGANPREALTKFMASAKAQDLEAMANVWGTSSGPARATLSREQWEQREVIMMGCLKHDSFSVLGEAPAAGGERVFAVEVKYRDLTRTTNFVVTRGPSERWYVRIFEIDPLAQICTSR